MSEWWDRGRPIDVETVLREWIEREARKSAYPDAEPAAWDSERLVAELTGTYDEPAEPVATARLDWREVELRGEELGELGTFPEPAWDEFSGDGTVGGAVERLEQPSVAAEFPDAVESIEFFADHPDGEFGAAVAWHRGDEWPPVLLDGNHRACGVHRAAREGGQVTLRLHLGAESLAGE